MNFEVMQMATIIQLVLMQLPQVLVQMYALVTERSVDEGHSSSAQLVSLGMSYTAVVLVTLRMDVSTDADNWLREANPSFAGYIPTKNTFMCSVSIFFTFTMMASGYAVKLMASCCLFWASHELFWLWLTLDIAIYHMVMVGIGNWTYAGPYKNDGNKFVSRRVIASTSFVFQSLVAIGISFIPSGVFRLPICSTGAVWIAWRCYMLASSGVMLHLSFYELSSIRNPGVIDIRDVSTQNIIWDFYVALVILSIVSLLVMYATARPVSRRMFTSIIPYKKFMERDLWFMSNWDNWGLDIDSHRALLLYKFIVWPSPENVKDWLEGRYESWIRNQPEWFSYKYMSIFPFWYLPKQHVAYLRKNWASWEEPRSDSDQPPSWFTPAWKRWIKWNPYDYDDSGNPIRASHLGTIKILKGL